MTPKPQILDAVHEKKRADYKKWISKPGMREHVRQRQREYYANHLDQMHEAQKKYREKYAETCSKSRVNYAKKHPERQRAQTFSGQYVKAKSACEKCGGTGKLERYLS